MTLIHLARQDLDGHTDSNLEMSSLTLQQLYGRTYGNLPQRLLTVPKHSKKKENQTYHEAVPDVDATVCSVWVDH